MSSARGLKWMARRPLRVSREVIVSQSGEANHVTFTASCSTGQAAVPTVELVSFRSHFAFVEPCDSLHLRTGALAALVSCSQTLCHCTAGPSIGRRLSSNAKSRFSVTNGSL